jgi:HTH-type transcriptional regulator, cell division transcriptional repressor
MAAEGMPAGDDWYSNEAATFGDRLAAAREALGMDQAALAEKIGVRLETLQKWEDDQSEPRANRLSMLSGVLNVPMRWLLTGEGEGLEGPVADDVLPADLQGLLVEMRVVQATLTRTAGRLARIEKRLKTALSGAGP